MNLAHWNVLPVNGPTMFFLANFLMNFLILLASILYYRNVLISLLILVLPNNGSIITPSLLLLRQNLVHTFHTKSNHLTICDLLQRNFPSVYPKSPIPCPSCDSSIDSNSHIIFCPKYSKHFANFLTSHETSLINFLFDQQPTRDLISKNLISILIFYTDITLKRI
ncbi:hypothetical protein C1645_358572 [Glomus cerebriforme]|uniref:Uncharacterized protein n=1 Tax=Glomus cerebriforme TaxID=658196 RepID=A0A397TF04_9GLOM|nr:hypothetical protein C1645_358572 [Glomus cerebriforme]